jgi:hypothetical protein
MAMNVHHSDAPASRTPLVANAIRNGTSNEFIEWFRRMIPYDAEYIPIVVVSVGFFVTTLISAIEAYRCRKAILSATVDDADAPRRTIGTNGGGSSSTDAPNGSTPPTSVNHGISVFSDSNDDHSSSMATHPHMTPPSTSFSISGRKILQPTFMQERQLQQQHQPHLQEHPSHNMVSNQQAYPTEGLGQEVPSSTRLTSGGAGVAAHYHSQQKGSKGDQTRLLVSATDF